MAHATPTTQRPAASRDATSPAAPPAPAAPAPNRPVVVFRFGAVSAAVFAQDVKKGDKAVTLASVSLQRAYRDTQGQWHYTHSLRPQDLLFASYALLKCYEFVAGGDEEDERR